MSLNNDIFTRIKAEIPSIGNQIFFGDALYKFPLYINIVSDKQTNSGINKSAYDTYLVTVTCNGNNYIEVDELADLVESKLDGHKFGTIKSCVFQSRTQSNLTLEGDADVLIYVQDIMFQILAIP